MTSPVRCHRLTQTRTAGWTASILLALLAPTLSAQSVILELSSDPLGMVEIQTTSGATVVELADDGTWSPARPSVPTPSRIALPPGAVVTLRGKEGISLSVSTDSLRARNLVLHGGTIRLQNTIIGGKPKLVVLEADEGVLGPTRGSPEASAPAVP